VAVVSAILVTIWLLIAWLSSPPEFGLHFRVDGADLPMASIHTGEEALLIQGGALVLTPANYVGENETFVTVSRFGFPSLIAGEGVRLEDRPVSCGERVFLKPGTKVHIRDGKTIEFRSCVPIEAQRAD
jgi:hypothetical protein